MERFYSLAVGKTLIILLSLMVLIFGCDAFNTNPPEYIKTLATYKEGPDGIVVYFVLADSSGQMTTSDGRAKLSVLATYYNIRREVEIELWVWAFSISKEQFKKAKVGVGPFSRDIICYSFGRITYDRFKYKVENNMRGKVRLEFETPQGRTLKSEDTFYF